MDQRVSEVNSQEIQEVGIICLTTMELHEIWWYEGEQH